jgi:hypothetical protein
MANNNNEPQLINRNHISYRYPEYNSQGLILQPFLSADCYAFIEYKKNEKNQFWAAHPLHQFHLSNYNDKQQIQAKPLAIDRNSEVFEFLTTFIRPSTKCKVSCISRPVNIQVRS